MFRLTREVRFAVNDLVPSPAPAVVNGYAGAPPLLGAGRFFRLQVTLAGSLQPHSHYLLNIKEIDRRVRDRAIARLAQLLTCAPGGFRAPAAIDDLFRLLRGEPWSNGHLAELRLWLTPFFNVSAVATELPMVRLSQKFEFSASHRLHNPSLSDEENRRTFGKCNNPHGHGHNYELQVTLLGDPNENGLLIDVPAFEQIVAETVIERLDHKNLNVQVPEFQDMIPSVENIARVIHGLLKPRLSSAGAKLASVTVWETPKTWCEYGE